MLDKNINHGFRKCCLFILLLCVILGWATISMAMAKIKNHTKPFYTVDIFGTDKISVDMLKSKYRDDFNHIAAAATGSLDSNNPLFESSFKKVIAKIEAMGDFVYVGISPIVYNDHIVHITIDVVEQADKERLGHFKPPPNMTIEDPGHLIETWQEYEHIGTSMFLKDGKPPQSKKCPAYHCIYGFDHPLLRPYGKAFTDLAEKNKHRLYDVLTNDKDENKRGAAVFLLAHIKNSSELFDFIMPSLKDPSAHVRNNVMRVMGAALMLHPCEKVKIGEIVSFLNSPSTTDRNKALFVIFSLVDGPNYAQYVLKHSGSVLIKLLKLQQTNNHDFAYLILKKLSHKNFSDRDYASWETWLKNNNDI